MTKIEYLNQIKKAIEDFEGLRWETEEVFGVGMSATRDIEDALSGVYEEMKEALEYIEPYFKEDK